MRLTWPLVFFVTMTFTPACGLFEPEHPTITVVKGDTLSKLARANGVTVAQLKEWNGLSSDTIEIGQVLALKIDPSAELAPAAPPSALLSAPHPRSTAKTSTRTSPRIHVRDPSRESVRASIAREGNRSAGAVESQVFQRAERGPSLKNAAVKRRMRLGSVLSKGTLPHARRPHES